MTIFLPTKYETEIDSSFRMFLEGKKRAKTGPKSGKGLVNCQINCGMSA